MEFSNKKEIKWCPGCGDFAILKALQKYLDSTGQSNKEVVFVSGIGCSSRLPSYMNCFGMHTLHGRAPAYATGIQYINPQLSTWVITGDGDGLSIGAGQLMHSLARPIQLKIVLFNNEIYGLTKGQASPTSKQGVVTPTTPKGKEQSSSTQPLLFALANNAKFVARGVDIMSDKLQGLFAAMDSFKGVSFLEILQNCIIYNDKTFDLHSQKSTASNHNLYLEHNQPMVFGSALEYGVYLEPTSLTLQIKAINDTSKPDILIHDKHNKNKAFLLSQLTYPLPLGIIYQSNELENIQSNPLQPLPYQAFKDYYAKKQAQVIRK